MTYKYLFKFWHGLEIKNILDSQPKGKRAQFVRECIKRRRQRSAKRWDCYRKIHDTITLINECRSQGSIHEVQARRMIMDLKVVLINIELEL